MPIIGSWEKAGRPDPFWRLAPAVFPVGSTGVGVWSGNIPGFGVAPDGFVYLPEADEWHEMPAAPFSNLTEAYFREACVVGSDVLVVMKRRLEVPDPDGPIVGAWWDGDAHAWGSEIEVGFSTRFAVSAAATASDAVIAAPGSMFAVVGRDGGVRQIPWPKTISSDAAVTVNQVGPDEILVMDVDPESPTWGECGVIEVRLGGWHSLPPCPLPKKPRDPVDRRWCIGDGGEFLVAGGGSAAAARLSVSAGQWTEATPAPCPHASSSTGYIRGWAVAAGGSAVKGLKHFTALLYNFADDSWAFTPEDYIPGGGCRMLTVGDRLWVWSAMRETDATLAELVLPL